MIIRRVAMALRRQDWPTVFVEFILVVLGVLLALQVDNWNEQRKERALFQNYVEQLQMDLREDIEEGVNAVSAADILDEAAAYLLSVIDGTAPEPIDRARLIIAILTSGYANLNLIHRQTFDELLSTGNLRIFPDNEIKRAVVRYYANWELSSQWNPMIRSVQTNYRQATRHLLTAEQFRWARENVYLTAGQPPSRPPPPFDLERFYREVEGDRELIAAINAMAEVQHRLRRGGTRMQRYAQDLIDRLDSYR